MSIEARKWIVQTWPHQIGARIAVTYVAKLHNTPTTYGKAPASELPSAPGSVARS